MIDTEENPRSATQRVDARAIESPACVVQPIRFVDIHKDAVSRDSAVSDRGLDSDKPLGHLIAIDHRPWTIGDPTRDAVDA
jgi:hypothetical protein